MTNTEPRPRHLRSPQSQPIPQQHGPWVGPQQGQWVGQQGQWAGQQQGQWVGRQEGPWAGPVGAPMPGGQVPGPQVPAPQPPRKAKKWPWVVGALGLLIVVGSIGDSGETSTTTPAAPAAAAAPAAPAESGSGADGTYGATTATFGQKVAAGDVTVTAQKPRERSQEFIGTQYCSSVTLRNAGSSPESFSPFDWKFRTAAGVEVTANIPFNADKALTSGSLRPGGTVSGEVCADTETTNVTEVVYSPGFGILHEVTFSG